jgi:uncharacterized protein YjbI with pentapeptide repeats
MHQRQQEINSLASEVREALGVSSERLNEALRRVGSFFDQHPNLATVSEFTARPFQFEHVRIRALSISNVRLPIDLSLKGGDIKGPLQVSNCSLRSIELHSMDLNGPTTFSEAKIDRALIISSDFHRQPLVAMNFSGYLEVASCRNMGAFSASKSEFAGLVTESDEAVPIAIKDCTFESELSLKSVFRNYNPTSVHFDACIFRNGVTMNGRSWNCPLSLAGSVFHGQIKIQGESFHRILDLSRIHAKSGLTTQKTVCHFYEDVLLSDARLGEAGGNSAESAIVALRGAQFHKKLDLSKATVFGSFLFDESLATLLLWPSANVHGDLNFQRGNVQQLSVEGGEISGSFSLGQDFAVHQALSVESMVISRMAVRSSRIPAKVQFRKCTFREVSLDLAEFDSTFDVQDSSVDLFRCRNVKFRDTTTFRKMVFKGVPDFHGTAFFPATSFRECDFRDRISISGEAVYRDLKHKMAGFHNTHDEMLFAAHEMASRRRHLGWDGEWFFSFLYNLINRYGTSITLPLVWLALLFALGLDYYSGSTSLLVERVEVNAKMITEGDPSWISVLMGPPCQGKVLCPKAAYFSFVNTLGPLRLFSPFNGVVAADVRTMLLSLVQAAASTTLWFIFISGIRRRFRLL